MTKWTEDAINAPHTQRELDSIPQSATSPCPHCGNPRVILRDIETLPVPGWRLVCKECEE